MSRSRRFLGTLLFVMLITLTPVSSRGQSQGFPWYTIPLPIPGGFVDAASGNIHIEIPIGAVQQRNGDPVVANIVYDSTQYVYNFNISGFTPTGPGWRTIAGTTHSGTATISVNSNGQSCPSGYPNGNVQIASSPSFKDFHGTLHTVVNNNLYTKQVNCRTNSGVPYGNGSDITSFTGIASDGSGYTFQVSNYTQLQVFSADGWLVYDNTGANGFNWPMDPNGNYIQYATGGMPDTLNRSPFQIGFYYCAGLNSYTNTVRSSDGSLATYTMTCSSQSVSQIVSGTQRAALKSFLTAITLPDGTSYSFTYDTGASGTHLGGLTSVTLPAGGTISFTQVPGIPSLAVGAINLPGRTATVSAGGGTWDLSYALNQTNQIVTTVVAPPRFDVASNSTVQDKSVFTSVPFNPYLQTAQYYSGSTALLRTVTYAYDASGNFLPVTVTTTLNDTGQSSSVSYQYFNQMRNYPTQKQETGFSGSVARTTTTTYGPNMRPTAVNIYSGTAAGPLIASTLFTYDEYSANYCKNGVPGLTVVTGVTGHKDGVGPSGNPTTVSRWISGTSYATSHACYDSLGNVTQLVDANGNPTTFDYSENWADTSCIPAGTNTHAFPTMVTNALGHRTKKVYFSCSSLPQSSADENEIRAGLSASMTYDFFGRTLTVNSPDGGQELNSFNSSVPPYQTSTTTVSSAVSLNSQTNLDSYGRVIQAQLTSDPDGVTYVDTTYDALGHVATASNPHRAGSASTDGVTTYNYDALGRVTRITNPDGSIISTTYSGPCVTVIDEAGKSRKSCTDALGRLVQVFEDPAGLNYETDYQYDALDNLTRVDQKGGSTNPANWRTRTFTYDDLSRITSATNPESGTITYTYDANGNLLTKSSPAPNQTGSATVTTVYSYDALNRLTQKSYSDGATPTVKYVYDGAAAPTGCTLPTLTINNGIGERTGMCDAAGAEAWSYDILGRTLADARSTNGISKTTTYTYNLDGSTKTISYPVGGEVVTYAPGGAGLPLSAVGSSTYVTNVHYAPGGALCNFQTLWGNTFTHNYSYNNRLQAVAMQVYGTGYGATTAPCTASADNVGTQMKLTYNFVDSNGYNNGNIISITNNVNAARSQTFSYDALNRLATAQTTSTYSSSPSNCWAETYTYDPWGNLYDFGANTTTQSAYIGCSQESGLHTTATSNNRLTAYSYDAAGNVIVIPGIATYTYNAENQIASAGGVTYSYDGDGRRVMKSGGTIYWYGTGSDPLDETDLAGTFRFRHYYFNGMRIARRESNNWVDHYALDHLGNTRWVYGNNGTSDLSDYYPFGGERSIQSSAGNKYKFTGKERDSESGLDYFGARYDSSSMGRFLSPDPENAGALLADPQSWNAYSYVENNPLNITDPDGMDPKDKGCRQVSANDGSGTLITICTHTEIEVKADLPKSEPILTVEIRGTLQQIGSAAGKANDYLRTAWDWWRTTRPDPGCLAAATASGAAFGASRGVVAGPIIQGALAIPTAGGSELLGGPAGGAVLGGLTGAGLGGAGGYLIGQITCRTGSGGGGGGSSRGGSGGGSTGPKQSPKFRPPTNPPQPPPAAVPSGWRVRIMGPAPGYPNGYWRLEKPMANGGWQGINPSTMKPGPQWETHVPLP